MQKQREHWGSHLGFILAAAGSAVGLGTLWKFPYVTGENGGGVFVLVYMFCTFFIGIPLFISELILGRKAQRGAVGTFAKLSGEKAVWKGVGWLGVLSSFIIMSYYSVIAGWGLNYVLMSLNLFYEGKTPEQIREVYDLLASSADITLFWSLSFTALTVGVVYRGIRQGVEYWSKFMTTALLIILVGLVSYSITLEGFGDAVHFLLYPDFSEFKPSSALEALGLSFFTLSLGQGIMITYGSYMRREEDIVSTSFIIGAMIIAISLLAGLMIFPIIFSFGIAPQSGPGLVFKTLPVIFSTLPGGLLISTSFFMLFTFTALTSSIALVEVVAANLIDLKGWSRKKAVLSVGAAAVIFGIPSALSNTDYLFNNWVILYGKTFFQTMDDLVSVWLLPIGGLLTAIFIGWFYSAEEVKKEFESGSRLKHLFTPWHFFIRWLTPIAIILIILQKTGLVDVDALF